MRKLNQLGSLHILPLLLLVAAVGIISFLLVSSTAPFRGGLFGILNPKPNSNAQMMMEERVNCGLDNPAFCDTFTTKFPVTRSGQLDPTKWIVSRIMNDNPSQGQ